MADVLGTAAEINKQLSVTAASGSAGTDVLRHCDLNDLSRTSVESKSNGSCNHRITCCKDLEFRERCRSVYNYGGLHRVRTLSQEKLRISARDCELLGNLDDLLRVLHAGGCQYGSAAVFFVTLTASGR